MNFEKYFNTEDLKESIINKLNEKQNSLFETDEQDAIIKKAMMAAAAARHKQAMQHNHRINGKLEIDNRVRNDKIQMNKKSAAVKGYKVVNGTVIKMTFAEMKRRKIAAKIASRKRKNEQATINRKRAISLKLRDNRLG